VSKFSAPNNLRPFVLLFYTYTFQLICLAILYVTFNTDHSYIIFFPPLPPLTAHCLKSHALPNLSFFLTTVSTHFKVSFYPSNYSAYTFCYIFCTTIPLYFFPYPKFKCFYLFKDWLLRQGV